jgi:glycerol-3-phosphate dehydrogenase
MLPRSDALAALASERFDVLVIGGGITGAGVALDAASRGYTVALVERGDFACGTSSRSSKLVHGGLRYLRTYDFGLVRESLLERRLMVRLAPHLVRPLPMLVPALGGQRLDRRLGLGLHLYDVLGLQRRGTKASEAFVPEVPGTSVPGGTKASEAFVPARHGVIGGDEVRELVPALDGRAPGPAYRYTDCITDDVRLVLTVLEEAGRLGAVAVNRVEALGSGRLRTAEGEELEVRARHVVNATGVWADRLGDVPRLRPSRGAHVLLPAEVLPLRAGVVVPAGEGRTVFLLPWQGRVLVGTTDTDHEGGTEHVRPTEGDVAYLLDACNAFFGTAFGPGDVAGAYAGVRPLVATKDPRRSVDISRRTAIYESPDGMVTVTGGKLTTWRRMAAQAVDKLVARDGRPAPCRTASIPLGQPAEGAHGEHLTGRYGAAAGDVRALAADGPLAEPVIDGAPDLLAEVVYAARHQQAATVGDVLLRRTRLGLTHARALREPGAVERVAAVLGEELGWGAARQAAEAAAFRAEADAEGLVPA